MQGLQPAVALLARTRLQALGYVELVPADRLLAFAAAREAEPLPGSPPGEFVVVPAGDRPNTVSPDSKR